MKLFYPDNLPIFNHKEEIIASLRKFQVVIIAGDTGSGKTTQLAKMGLEAFPENDKLIGCTQPRRIAASTVATRVAEELGELSMLVGYKIRFHDTTSSTTRIKFMTDGVLLAETRQDRLLSRYRIIIIDEAHERSLNIDFLLGYLKQLLPLRPDLKVIITSATIDTEAFSRHFDKAPILSVAGRAYPVSLKYLPPSEEAAEEKDGIIDHCVDTITDLLANEPRGDILVFLPTERDIRECCLLLEKKTADTIILPLFGRLPSIDQRKIFERQREVKIVVATNVAETSITVPGIRYVVDSGLARISYYNSRAKTTSLPISRISQASCNQRKGRCGRSGPGICIRLYTEEDYNDRAEYTLPEVKRSNLAEVLLQMISLGLGKPETFPFIDPPHKSVIKEGYQLLGELGAIDERKQLTEKGRIMADLPMDPCISRVLIEARDNNCLKEMKIIAALLAIQDPRIRPVDHEKEADEAHKSFAHPQSDFMMLLNIWNNFMGVQEQVRSWSRLKKYCKANYLSFQRMREWIDLHDQLARILQLRNSFFDNEGTATYEHIHKSILSGFLRNIARKKQSQIYQGANNQELMIFPGSHQFLKGGQWLVAASFIETTRLYALTVATIESDWIEAVAGPLCKYSWTNPHWQKKTGQVVADETTSLFGLILNTGRKVNFGRRNNKNIVAARDIFIQSALVAGEISGSYQFLLHNQTLIRKWQEVENKLRARTIVVDDLVFYQFYAEKLPADVYDQATLNRYLKNTNRHKFLMMSDEDILRRKPDDLELIDYPPTLNVGNVQIRLEYHFEPGSENDGVTFRLPIGFAVSISPTVFEWLVPGLLPEKLMVLLKALPKNLRKKMVPISDTVNWLLDELSPYSGSLYAALEAAILKRFKLLTRSSDWSDNLPLHLQPRFLLFDDVGNTVCTGRNLKELLGGKLAKQAPKHEAGLLPNGSKEFQSWYKTEHRTWAFQDLPTAIPAFTSNGEVAGFFYPVLIAQPGKGCVIIDFEKNKRQADRLNREGMLFLYRLHFAEQYKALKKFCGTAFSGPSAIWLFDLELAPKEVVDTLLDFLLCQIFGPFPQGIILEKEFIEKNEDIKRQGLFALGKRMCEEFIALLRKRRAVLELIGQIFNHANNKKLFLPNKETEFQHHLSAIFPKNILQESSPYPFTDIDRYLHCLTIRLQRFQANPTKDHQKAELLAKHQQNLASLAPLREEFSEEGKVLFHRYRALVNEYRIAIFSPELRTHEPISEKKLDQVWQQTKLVCR